MCFLNDGPALTKFRAKKRPIEVWKMGQIDPKTGHVLTHGRDGPHNILWIQGTIVKPNVIQKPLKHGQQCTNGLYFYAYKQNYDRFNNDMVLALVNPKDIIAVQAGGRQILAVAATVTKAIKPNRKQKRLEYLTKIQKKAREDQKYQKQMIKKWQEIEPDQTEALQQIEEELAQLTKGAKNNGT